MKKELKSKNAKYQKILKKYDKALLTRYRFIESLIDEKLSKDE